jgi:hypothetical protein
MRAACERYVHYGAHARHSERPNHQKKNRNVPDATRHDYRITRFGAFQGSQHTACLVYADMLKPCVNKKALID